MRPASNELLNPEAQRLVPEQQPAPRSFPAPRPAKRPFLWLLVGVTLVVGGFLLYRHFSTSGRQTIRYKTVTVGRGAVEKQVTATGTLSSLVTVTVGSQVTGRIQEILADYNSTVTKGQVIARIDSQIFRTEVDKAQANLAAARANLQHALATAREAKLQYERDRDLAGQKVVAPAEVETRLATYQSTEAQVAASRASIEQAQAALKQARTNLAYSTIVSPINGIIVSRNVDVGQTVAASLQAPTLFTIAEDLRKMEVHTSVAESDVGYVREGMSVRFSVDAFPDEQFAGEVKQVRYEAQTVQNVVTYDAVIRVENPQLKLRPGMTANITFVVASRQGVLKLPNAALRYRPPNAEPPPVRKAPTVGGPRPPRTMRQVWVLRQGAAVPVRVTMGISDGSYTEVAEGPLQEGDEVIVGVLEGGSPSGEGQGSRRPGGGPGHGPPRLL